jgi:Mg-chelatase subunit ChlD
MAVVAIPVMASVGMAVDYTRANAARSAFQVSLDASALMLSKTVAGQTSEALQAQATNVFNALFQRPEVTNVVVTPSYTTAGGSKLTLNGTATVNTNFLGILGISQIDISATAVSTWGNTRLRVALVLDNTGSMSSAGKMDALKAASQNLLTQLKNAAVKPEDVYVSIVPFSKDVNFDPANYNESWIRWDLWEERNGTCSDPSYHRQSSCVSHGKVWTPAAHSTWNGCVTDRDQNFDTTNDAPTVGSTLYPAEQYSSCSVPLMGLSNDWTALSAKIDSMTPVGNTNQAIGLQAGWQTLTAAPFTVPPVDPDYKYQTVIILLTDGLNTQDRWYTSQSSIDAREQKTCDNIKAAGITMYTVQVNTGSDPASTLLQNCASDLGKYFLLTEAGQIVTTFGQIGTSLSKLRLAM